MVAGRTSVWTVALLAGASFVTGCGGGGNGNETAGVQPAAGAFGGRLQSEASFTVVLAVVEERADAIDFVGVACAPEGTLAGGPVTVGEAVAIEDGRFAAESGDVAIEGEFSSQNEASGTIRALSSDAEGCGVPSDGRWSSRCDMSVTSEPEEEVDEGGIAVGGVMGTTDQGTAFATFEVTTARGDRLVADLLDSGTCVD